MTTRKMQLKTTGCSEAWLVLPVPMGPYIMVSQHKYAIINQLDKGPNLKEVCDILGEECKVYAKFDLHFGFLTYGADASGKYQCVGAYLDTSD